MMCQFKAWQLMVSLRRHSVKVGLQLGLVCVVRANFSRQGGIVSEDHVVAPPVQ